MSRPRIVGRHKETAVEIVLQHLVGIAIEGHQLPIRADLDEVETTRNDRLGIDRTGTPDLGFSTSEGIEPLNSARLQRCSRLFERLKDRPRDSRSASFG